MQQTQTVAISAIAGMGGVGKTELALQYALQSSRDKQYPGGICWLNARSLNVGIQIVNFARKYLKLQPPEGWELLDQVKHCWHNWLPGDVLIVLDDLTKYEDVKPYLPPIDLRFKVLMTTRLQLGAPIKRLDLEVLTPEAALAMLRSYIGKKRVDSQLDVAKKLCKWLGYLPLGLELVGRYLADEEDLSIVEIQQLLALKCEALDETHPEMTAKLGVVAAFELSWQELDENAQVLGYLLSLFASAPIPWSLVESATDFWQEYQTHQGINSLADSESPLKRTEDTDASRFKPTSAISPELKFRAGKATIPDLKKARRALLKFNLIKRTKKDTYELHQLIREFFLDKREESAEAEELKLAFCRAMVAEAKTIPATPTLKDIAAVRLAIPHIGEAATTQKAWLDDEDLIRPFVGLGRFYEGQGDYKQAEPWREQCLSLTKARLGENHPDVATSINNLAELYYYQGRYTEAEPLYLQALEWRQRNLGENHSDVAESLNNLAALYYSQRRYTEAEPLFLQALELRQRLLGENHPDVALSLNNLAYLYSSQGRYSEAEPLLEQALELSERVLGLNHPNTVSYRKNLQRLRAQQVD
ncbi:MAG: tetratricopeptide repeat protein [Coleofasciculaceae cyanobacterium]